RQQRPVLLQNASNGRNRMRRTRAVGYLHTVRSRARGVVSILIEGRHGVGAALVRAAEDWARQRGYRELASDTWIDDIRSQCAHEALGFIELDRVVNYRKML